jgi:hypothetical protein
VGADRAGRRPSDGGREVAQALIHRWVGVKRLVQNNEIAGFKFATIGVIYAVLLAFSVIVVWEKFSAAENAVDQEAAAIAALFQYAQGNEPQAVALRTALVKYTTSAIHDDWPAMSRESESAASTRALDAVYANALALSRTGTRETADMAEVFASTTSLPPAASASTLRPASSPESSGPPCTPARFSQSASPCSSAAKTCEPRSP